MDDEIRRMLGLVERAQTAWDQYTIQRRLPDQTGWLTQGHPWDQYNNGSGAPQARRDPAAMNAAWNDLETALLELSYSAQRVRACRPTASAVPRPRPWYDVRTGAFTQHASPASPTVLAERPETVPDEARLAVSAGG